MGAFCLVSGVCIFEHSAAMLEPVTGYHPVIIICERVVLTRLGIISV